MKGSARPAGETLYDVPGEMPGEMPEAVACDSAADLAREAAFGGTGDGAEAERVEKTERTAASNRSTNVCLKRRLGAGRSRRMSLWKNLRT